MPDNIASRFLCDVCNALFTDASFDWWAKYYAHNPRGFFEANKPDFPGHHHLSCGSFSRAVAAQCWICVQINAREAAATRFGEEFEPIRYLLRHSVDDEDPASSGYQLLFEPGLGRYIIQEVQPWTELHGLAETVKSRTWTGDDGLLALAKRWLVTCQEQHRTCSKSLEAEWYPTRLLDVSTDTVRLLISSQERLSGPYATLSHCWGTKKFWVLAKDTFSQLLNGVPLSTFLPTFQQAITTVRRLGVKYLWIDCYCIIQGLDAEAQADWLHEAERMGQVYSNTLINIAACHASGPAQGLFSYRGTHQFETLTVSWRPSTYGEKKFYRLKTQQVNSGNSDTFRNLCNSPLAKRGWVVQESVLSPRMLSFNGPILFWQCSEITACEDYPWEFVTDNEKASSPFWALTGFAGASQAVERANTTSRENIAQQERRIVKSIRKRWFDTMSNYGSTSLTYPEKDIFKAIAGVAQRAAQLTDDVHQQGLLQKTMPHALLWTTNSKGGGSAQPGQAPTWHWASSPYQIDFVMSASPYQEDREEEFRCSAPDAFVFMSDDCNVFARAEERDLWPSLMCIGRLVKVKHVYSEREREYRLQLPSSHSSPFAAVIDHGIILDPKSEAYVLFPLVREVSKELRGAVQRLGLNPPPLQH